MRQAYLVLDEPVAMLDAAGRSDVLDVVRRFAREEGRGVLHVSHRLEDVADADRAVALAEGVVVYDGPVGGLLEDESLMTRAGLSLPPLAVLAREERPQTTQSKNGSRPWRGKTSLRVAITARSSASAGS